jgi:hypothetical protein
MLTIPRYPRATENRVPGHDKSVVGIRRRFLKAAFINFAILQLLFFALFAYIFGSIYQVSYSRSTLTFSLGRLVGCASWNLASERCSASSS